METSHNPETAHRQRPGLLGFNQLPWPCVEGVPMAEAAVPHPRWSQAEEKVLGTSEKIPTQISNGYGEHVAGLYQGLEGEKLFM